MVLPSPFDIHRYPVQVALVIRGRYERLLQNRNLASRRNSIDEHYLTSLEDRRILTDCCFPDLGYPLELTDATLLTSSESSHYSILVCIHMIDSEDK